MTQRPVTTLFLLMSADGKISTGSTDQMDVDRDFPAVPGLREGLPQYYDIEKTTDLWSLNSGRVQAKLGVNERPLPSRGPVSFVLIDNTHLTAHGAEYFCALSQTFVLVTSNPSHPAFFLRADNLHILFQETFDPLDMLVRLRAGFGCERLTIQTGGTLNGLLLRAGVLDYADLVVAPVLVGGRDTPTAVDGPSLTAPDQLSGLGVLELKSCQVLDGSFLRLRYRVVR